MKHTSKIIAATIIGAGLAVASTAALSGDDDSINPQDVANASVSFNNAVDIALATVPGIVLEAEFEAEDGKSVWEVEILGNDEKLYEVEIDAQTGEALVQQDVEDDD